MRRIGALRAGGFGSRAVPRTVRAKGLWVTSVTAPGYWRWQKSDAATANAGAVTESAGFACRTLTDEPVGPLFPSSSAAQLLVPSRVSVMQASSTLARRAASPR